MVNRLGFQLVEFFGVRGYPGAGHAAAGHFDGGQISVYSFPVPPDMSPEDRKREKDRRSRFVARENKEDPKVVVFTLETKGPYLCCLIGTMSTR
jgi:hypothetical protein